MMEGVLAGPLTPLVVTAAAIGVVSHVTVFRTIEVEQYQYNLLASSVALVVGLLYAFLALTDLSVLQSLARVTSIAVAFDAGLLVSMVVYRLFFHRLRQFPGPVGAKVTRFWAAYRAGKEVKYYREIEKLHEQYGDFIRTGPRELCIVRESAVPLIYGPKSECLKTTWYSQVSTDHTKCSIHMTRDFDDHRKRRKAWDKGFSIKALASYEPRIKAKADTLVAQLGERGSQSIDGTAWSMFFSFDVMGAVGFSKDFNNLTTGEEHPAIQGIHAHMAILGVLANVPWLLNLASRIPGAAAPYSSFFGWCASEIVSKQKTYDPEQTPSDIVAWLLKAFMDKDASATPSEESLHEDSRVVIIAGSETTATTLATILYYLAKYPHVQQKLQAHLDAAMPGRGRGDWSYDAVKTVSYIDDIIHETLRLKPALLTGGYRVTPPHGLRVDGTFIPGDVNVFVPVQRIQTDARYYPEPTRFLPERWGERKEELGTEKAPYLPFSLGAYSCPGKNLAMLSLRIALSRIAQEFDVAFAPGETGEKFDKDALDTFTTTLPPLQLRFTRRGEM